MANLIGVVGAPGTGKSTSMRNLDENSTYIVNVLSKPLPFKGSAKKYNKDKKNYADVRTWNEVTTILRGVSEKRPDIKTIVLDDIGFIMSLEFFKRAKETGYSKFAEIGQHMFEVINTAKELREDLNVIFMFHEELQLVDGFTPQRKIKTIGRMLDDKFTPEALFSVLLYTHVDTEEDKEASYKFVTNKVDDYPAKSPMGMFEERYVPNDMAAVLSAIDSYYNS